MKLIPPCIITKYFLLFQFSSYFSISQTEIFKEYDFSDKGYTLTITNYNIQTPVLLEEQPVHSKPVEIFSTKSSSDLNEIKKSLVLKKDTSTYYNNKPTHYLELYKNNQSILSLFIDTINNKLENYIAGTFYEFDQTKYISLKNALNKQYYQYHYFNLVSQIDSFIKSIKNDQNLLKIDTIFYKEEEKFNFKNKLEIEFIIDYKCRFCWNFMELHEKKLSKEINKKYPNENFRVECFGGNTKYLEMAIISKHSLANKFTIHGGFNKKRSQLLHYTLKTLWINKP